MKIRHLFNYKYIKDLETENQRLRLERTELTNKLHLKEKDNREIGNKLLVAEQENKDLCKEMRRLKKKLKEVK
ncbi:MAG: hypothetical protein J6T15_03580 [Bacilli bacterium]|nr:hypothetical protein [Bacilli bacterium]